jgi:hypothetical protein
MYLKHQYSLVFLSICLLLLLGGPVFAQSPSIKGPGCTTATMIDWDCDGYGPGSPLGSDADDNDSTVNTSATALGKYGTTAAILAHLGYNPTRMFFISTSGSNSTGQVNNQNLPYATWGGVSGLIQPGDAVIWRAGTYPMSAPLNITGGTSTAPVVYMAYPGEKVVLDWSAVASDGVRADGLSYWTVDGLVIKGGTNGYGIAEQQYNDVTNMTLRNVETSGWYDGVFFMDHMSNILIERSVFHDLYIDGEHNLYIGNSTGPSPNLTFRNNIMYKAGQAGGHNLHLNGRFPNAYVGGNIFYANLNQCIGMQMGINHSMFENNVCFTSAHSAIFLLDYYQASNSVIQAYDQNYNTFRNNTFYYDGMAYNTGAVDCTQYPLWVADQSVGSGSLSNPTNASHDLGHNTFDNNIFYNACPNPSALVRYDTDGNGKGGAAWLATDTFRNNIFYYTGTPWFGFFLSFNNSQSASTTKTFAQFQVSNLGGATNYVVDPMLLAANPAWYTAAQNFNLQLQSGSPAMKAGLAADAPSVDIMNHPRGSTPDIGAYQSSGGNGSTPALTIGTTSLLGGTAGTAYTQALSASGGTAPYAWSIASGSLPAGLSLAGGTISGTPTTAGTSSFTVQVADSASHTATAALGITIAAAPPVAALSALSCATGSLSSNGSTTCALTVTAGAPSGGASVSLSSNCSPLTVPSSVTVASGATTATFTATTGTVSASQTGVITATYSSASKTASISLTASAPAPALSSLSCGASSLASGGSTTCTVALTAAATSGASVALSSNSTLLTVPASVTVASGANSATFTATAGTISSGATATITGTYSGVSKTASISLTAPASAPALSSLSCGASSLASGGSTTCTVALTAAATSGTPVSFASNSSLLTVPASVTVASGASSATFTAAAGTISSGATATITGTYSGVSKTASISLTAPASAPASARVLSSLSCGASSLASGGSTTCTVALSTAATSGTSVSLSSNSSLLTVPASVTVASGASSATFTAAAGTITTAATATITGTYSGASKTASISLTAPAPVTQASTGSAFALQGVASEVSATTNGATVTPQAGPVGRLIVRETGAVNFQPSGVTFKQGGQQNINTAFYNFAGAQLGNVFNVSSGQISLTLTSSYSFAARQALPQYNYRQVFDAWDNSQDLFFFQVQAVWGRLMFYYNMGGRSGTIYYVPVGMEDSLFGQGAAMNVKMVWNGRTMSLYLNGNLVNQTRYTKATPNWSSASSFSLGAADFHSYGGGYYSCDDAISQFQVQN